MRLVHLKPFFGTLHASQGRTVLAMALDGSIDGGEHHGLFVHNTRVVSRYRHLIDGAAPVPLTLSNVDQHTWLGYYALVPPGRAPDPPERGSGQVPALARNTLEMRVSRFVGEGMHEDVDLTNWSAESTRFGFVVQIDGDFRGQAHPDALPREPHRIRRSWMEGAGGPARLRLDYQAWHDDAAGGRRELHRALQVRVLRSSSPPSSEAGGIGFVVDLPPGGRWHACLELVAELDGVVLPCAYACRAFGQDRTGFGVKRSAFLDSSTAAFAPGTRSLAPLVTAVVDQARRDLVALRLFDLDRTGGGWTMAAGLPQFVALFGRDVLTTGWQAALLGPEMMIGALGELADRQGTRVDDWRDEQPGKMLHEAHTGPMELLDLNPRARSYSSITTSTFYPVVVSELWHWTGDLDLVRPFVRPALEALAWLDRDGDLDGDGFYEYLTRSSHGVRHQAWKDSPDGIVNEEGAQVDPPIATCEEQGFAYLGKLHLSDVLWWMGDTHQAHRLFSEARELKARFNEAFWMPEEGTFAMGLDSRKQQIRSVGSNAGHCLATGIAETSLAALVADRLMRDDLFSGWGIRTLSSRNPAYNPFSYHRGSIWPVENATFALAFMRYGLHGSLERLVRSQFDAAALFDVHRLPEAFSGHPRDADHPFPSVYPKSNSPQAWSASAVCLMLQSLLGLYPYAPLSLLLVDPFLPPWLPEITLENLRVGRARVTLRFVRRADGSTDHEILALEGTLHVVRQPSPWSLTATFGERLKDLLTGLLPV